MASKQELINRQYNNAQKTFRFTISEPSQGTKVLYTMPDGWQDNETTYTRSDVYGSVLRNLSTNELTFYKEGRDFIQSVYENSGIDANITFAVEKLDKTDYTYKSYPSANKIDLSTYEIDEIGVRVGLVDTEFKEKLINRDDTEVDIMKNESIEGLILSDFDVDELLMPSTIVDNQGTVSASDNVIDVLQVINISGITAGDFTEIQIPGTSTTTNAGSFFYDSQDERLISFVVVLGVAQSEPNDADLVEVYLRHFDSFNNIINDYVVDSNNSSLNYTINKTQVISLSTGDSVSLLSYTEGSAPIVNITGGVQILEQNSGNEATDVYAFPYYEALLKTLQITTDKADCFYSDFFGRTDTPIEQYASDGEIGFITKGVFFRELDSQSATIPIKFKELFESLSTVFRLGMGVEDGRVRIEPLDYFYDENVVLDISDRLRQEDIKKNILPERFYKSIKVGYDSFEYEEDNGFLEFNTNSSWTSVLKAVTNDFSKVSQYRADGEGMRKIMNAVLVDDYDPKNDVNGDSDIFLIDSYRYTINDVSTFFAVTDQGFLSINGDVYADSSYNIKYSPSRILDKWGPEIKAGLLHSVNTYVKWQSSEKNNTLSSRLTTESASVYEDRNRLVYDFDSPRYINESYTVEAPITVAELQAVDASPNGLIKLSDTKYGWIQEMKTTNKDGNSEFTLLRCNLDVVTPID